MTSVHHSALNETPKSTPEAEHVYFHPGAAGAWVFFVVTGKIYLGKSLFGIQGALGLIAVANGAAQRRPEAREEKPPR